MKDKLIFLSALQIAFSSLPMLASPLVSVGDFADIFGSSSSSVRSTSNVFRDADNEQNEIVYTVSPGFELNLGRGQSNLETILTTSYDIVEYSDHPEVDAEMFHIRAVGAYRSSRWDVDAIASFDERQSAASATTGANLVGVLIKTEDVTASLNGEYRMSPKFSFSSGINYVNKEYIEPKGILADYEYTYLPFNFYYEWTPKVDLSVGYRYGIREIQATDFTAAYETTTHFLNVGARGVLSEKLTGSVRVGYSLRDSESTGGVSRDNSDGTIGLDGNLSWATTPKLLNEISFSRDFGVSGDGNATQLTSISVKSSYLISYNWSLGSNLDYTLRDYQDNSDRKDDQYSIGLNLNYIPNSYWRFSTGYYYSENDSSEADRSFDDHTIMITASLRY